jgi:hypothetical protein
MIIVRSPLRISLGGGGTDLPSYYKEHEGLSAEENAKADYESPQPHLSPIDH